MVTFKRTRKTYSLNGSVSPDSHAIRAKGGPSLHTDMSFLWNGIRRGQPQTVVVVVIEANRDVEPDQHLRPLNYTECSPLREGREISFYRQSTQHWTHIITMGVQAGGDNTGDVEVDERSTKISGCHEALETRTRRVRYMFPNDASFQLHSE